MSGTLEKMEIEASEDFRSRLFSPKTLRLPVELKQQAETFIQALYRLSSTPEYRAHFSKKATERGIQNPGNRSLFMCYDFHVTSNNELKLIEVNTNAALLAASAVLYKLQGVISPFDFPIENVKEDTLTEWRLFSRKKGELRTIAIIDEAPEQQAMFPEFRMYKTLFEGFGWDCDILDYRELRFDEQSQKLRTDLKVYDFIYNRYCDFYLAEESSRELRKAFLKGQSCLSPQPYEYFLLADKERMVDWQQDDFAHALKKYPDDLDVLFKTLPESKVMDQWDLEELWQQRKKYFFKPLRSFGSKQTYRGSSISRKLFQSFHPADFLVQEFVPAPEVQFNGDEKPYKYDLRFYTYQDKVEQAVARLYQGQVTNMRTVGGGLTTLAFTE